LAATFHVTSSLIDTAPLIGACPHQAWGPNGLKSSVEFVRKVNGVIFKQFQVPVIVFMLYFPVYT
jgi:hypothetical protein